MEENIGYFISLRKALLPVSLYEHNYKSDERKHQNGFPKPGKI